MEPSWNFDLLDMEKPKRREKLHHLSEQQKMERRKMLNRQAAQKARDRNKSRLDILEEIVIKLKEENNQLRLLNTGLRQKCETLSNVIQQQPNPPDVARNEPYAKCQVEQPEVMTSLLDLEESSESAVLLRLLYGVILPAIMMLLTCGEGSCQLRKAQTKDQAAPLFKANLHFPSMTPESVNIRQLKAPSPQRSKCRQLLWFAWHLEEIPKPYSLKLTIPLLMSIYH